MFNTYVTNVYNFNGPQYGGRKVDPWTKVAAVAGVVTMLFTALPVALAISASHPATTIVTVPVPVYVQPPRAPTIIPCSAATRRAPSGGPATNRYRAQRRGRLAPA
ncbi:MAG TPA: hypothetical protein VN618_12370 [Solirubrobacteraceae bacterium]|nr:hypothetical protein [Solirubrobacteraceae bacterium]